jgi:hypothetical protein
MIFGSGAVNVGSMHWRNKKASRDNISRRENHEIIMTEKRKCSERENGVFLAD